jgi:hypothetical protein
MGIQKDQLLKMSLEEIINFSKGNLKKVAEIIEQINKDVTSSLTHESSSINICQYILSIFQK